MTVIGVDWPWKKKKKNSYMTSPTVFIVECNWEPCPLNHSIPCKRTNRRNFFQVSVSEKLFIPSSWNASKYEECILQFHYLFFSALVARKLKVEYVREFLLLAWFCLLYFYCSVPSSILLFSTCVLARSDPFVCC